MPELVELFGVAPKHARERGSRDRGIALTHTVISFDAPGEDSDPNETVRALADLFRGRESRIRRFAERERQLAVPNWRGYVPDPLQVDIGHWQRNGQEGYSLAHSTIEGVGRLGAAYTFSTYADTPALVAEYFETFDTPEWTAARTAWEAATQSPPDRGKP